MKKEIRNCLVCGNEFETRTEDQLYCSKECKQMADEERRRLRNIQRRRSPSRLDAFMKQVDEYNRKHGTHLSYGKYREKFGYHELEGK